ncbi:hypothetical protein NM688_g5857 [Phlebia brevispora]|uniref:Uncharacterized protein n=1 Tax=Phlebia brevispora TaxID=194682 RepID=A0ACC1SNZ6_9APHY|nr:hypothetical protein NM688_g5857 [Phlebia brevispora]
MRRSILAAPAAHRVFRCLRRHNRECDGPAQSQVMLNAAVVSILVLLVYGLSKVLWKTFGKGERFAGDDSAKRYWQRCFIRAGSIAIFVSKFCRFDATFALLILDLYSANKTNWAWNSIIMVITTSYMLFLAVLNVFASRSVSRAASMHLTWVSSATFLTYTYRDLWPLMTFTLRPLDEAEGILLWIKIALSSIIAVIIPLLEPYPYVPANPEDAPRQPNPEQTASIASFLFYTFLDPTIWRAYRVPHLSLDQLPPLCDDDDANRLKQKSYPYLDPFSGTGKGRLFFGFVRVFYRSVLSQCAVLLVMALAKITSPIATNRLLNYLEQGGDNSLVKPWVWIVLIAIGPMTYSVTHQLYRFLTAASTVHVESIITSLVFDHALRLRVKGEVSQEKVPAPVTVTASEADEVANEDLALVKDTEEVFKAERGNENLTGKLNNLITSDLDSITEGCYFLLVAVSTPLQTALSVWFLYKILGWSSIAGLVVMVVLFPLPTWGARFMDTTEERKMKATDARVQNVTEMMNSLRMIKLFGWESRAKEEASKRRDEELTWIWRRRMLEIANGILNHIIPMIHMVVTYTIYVCGGAAFVLGGTSHIFIYVDCHYEARVECLGCVLVSGRQVSYNRACEQETDFSPAFNIIRDQLYQAFYEVPKLIRANVSLRRVAEFLATAELLDSFTDGDTNDTRGPSNTHIDDIGFGTAEFTWSSEHTDGASTPSKQQFRLRIDEDVSFKKGRFNMIVGPTGCGKTSVLMALLGEMHYIPLHSDSWLNLPGDGGVAYAAQESWVQNETIRNNILFGAAYDEERYQKVIYQCALTLDLKLLDAGDATEVGEKGLNLRQVGGQKVRTYTRFFIRCEDNLLYDCFGMQARITLARAIYSSADILLLDDVLSALDTHTARWIVNKCFKGGLVRGRTVILVTHNIGLVGSIADFVVSLSSNGRIDKQGSVSDVLSIDPKATDDVVDDRDIGELVEVGADVKESSDTSKDGKLIVAEEVEVGRVSRSAMMLLWGALGGSWPALFWSQYTFVNILTEVSDTLEYWWLGWWASQYALRERGEVSIAFYLGVYASLVFMTVLLHIWHTVLYAGATMRSSRTIHGKLISSLVGSTFRWLDVTPVSRVIARCTQDIQAVDGPVAQYLMYIMILTCSMIAKLGAILIYAPVFLLTAAAVAVVGGYLAQIYMKAQLPVKREMSNAKAPVLGIFGGAVAGLTSIRAYGAQKAFRDETEKRINRYVRCARTFYNLNRWIAVRIDALSATFAASLAFYFTYGSSSPDPSSIGFILIMAVSFSNAILFCVQIWNEFEVSDVPKLDSLERIQQYITIEQEPEPADHGTPPAYWPASGDLRVEKLCARYAPVGNQSLEQSSRTEHSTTRYGHRTDRTS